MLSIQTSCLPHFLQSNHEIVFAEYSVDVGVEHYQDIVLSYWCVSVHVGMPWDLPLFNNDTYLLSFYTATS